MALLSSFFQHHLTIAPWELSRQAKATLSKLTQTTAQQGYCYIGSSIINLMLAVKYHNFKLWSEVGKRE